MFINLYSVIIFKVVFYTLRRLWCRGILSWCECMEQKAFYSNHFLNRSEFICFSLRQSAHLSSSLSCICPSICLLPRIQSAGCNFRDILVWIGPLFRPLSSQHLALKGLCTNNCTMQRAVEYLLVRRVLL